MKILTHSQALLSTYTAFPDYNLMIDCGEGAATSLYRQTGSIKHLAITHEHWDHVAGLIQFLNIRSRLNPDSKINLYLPTPHERFSTILEMLNQPFNTTFPHDETSYVDNPKAKINVIYVGYMGMYDIGGGRFLAPFKTAHSNMSAGYTVFCLKKKLLDKYKNVHKDILIELKKKNVKIEEDIAHNLISYTGDFKAPYDKNDLEIYSNSDNIFLDATYLNDSDAEGSAHCTIEKSYKFGVDSRAKNIFLQHFSPRYKEAEIVNIAQRLVIKHKKDVFIILQNKILSVYIPIGGIAAHILDVSNQDI